MGISRLLWATRFNRFRVSPFCHFFSQNYFPVSATGKWTDHNFCICATMHCWGNFSKSSSFKILSLPPTANVQFSDFLTTFSCPLLFFTSSLPTKYKRTKYSWKSKCHKFGILQQQKSARNHLPFQKADTVCTLWFASNCEFPVIVSLKKLWVMELAFPLSVHLHLQLLWLF